jgi:hypothetical protein
MYPRRMNMMSPQDKREKERLKRKEQLKHLITNRLKSKYSYGPDMEERNSIITREVNLFIESEK